MIKIYSKLLLTSALLSPYLFSDTIQVKEKTKPAFETVWQKIYGGEDDDVANAVVMLEPEFDGIP